MGIARASPPFVRFAFHDRHTISTLLADMLDSDAVPVNAGQDWNVARSVTDRFFGKKADRVPEEATSSALTTLRHARPPLEKLVDLLVVTNQLPGEVVRGVVTAELATGWRVCDASSARAPPARSTRLRDTLRVWRAG